jgi:hypothetical protein
VIVDEQALVIINLRKKAKVVLTRDAEEHQVGHLLNRNLNLHALVGAVFLMTLCLLLCLSMRKTVKEVNIFFLGY